MRKNILAPSILSADFANLGRDVSAVEQAGAKYLHIDVMDGIFVPSLSIGFPVIETLRPVSRMVFDVHLMITDPLRYIDRFAAAGADIITFHQEAAFDCRAVIERIKHNGVKAGMSVKPHTEAASLIPYLKDLDLVLVMTVEPGFGGQKYIDFTTEKVRLLRAELDRLGLSDRVDLEVDGGVKLDNVHVPLDAGANVIVAGSAVFGDDPADSTTKFLKEMS